MPSLTSSLASLAFAVLLGLASFASVELVRAAPGIRTLVAAGRKPFACDTCMSLWTGLAWMTGALYLDVIHRSFLTFAAAFVTIGTCLLALTWRGPAMPPPPPEGS